MLCDIKPKLTIPYQTPEEHNQHLERVFQILKDNQLRINSDKTKLAQSYVQFLGLRLGRQGAEIDLTRYEVLLNLPHPTTRAKMRSFLGFVQFFSTFLPNLSEATQRLHSLLHQKEKYNFYSDPQYLELFDDIRGRIIEASMLHVPDYNKAFHIYVDSSKTAVGAILMQKNKDGNMVPIAFGSKMCRAAQQNYGITTLELYGIHTAVTHMFHKYIHACEVHIYTDHLNVVKQFKAADTTDRRRRAMLAQLAEYRIMSVTHIAGKILTGPDTISRIDWLQSIPSHLSQAENI